MNRTSILIIFLVALCIGASGVAALESNDERVVKQFQSNARAYLSLRNGLIQTPRPSGDIVESGRQLSVRIRAARNAAKEGDIFTPAVQALFKRLLQPYGAQIRSHQFDDSDIERPQMPRTWLHVNGAYPEEEPRLRVPPIVLQKLPALPDGLQYRFAGADLMLLDVRANVIVDLMRNAIQ
jgi:hypothetical protein